MIVNDRHRFVFVHVPKAAGTSIRTALAGIEGNNTRLPHPTTKHETAAEFAARIRAFADAHADSPRGIPAPRPESLTHRAGHPARHPEEAGEAGRLEGRTTLSRASRRACGPPQHDECGADLDVQAASQQHDPPSFAPETDGLDYVFFCFVRNPWDRFLSLYRYLRLNFATVHPVPDTLDAFASMLADRTPWVMKLHSIRPQVEFAAGPVSSIGRYETLAADFSAVCRELGVDPGLPVLNQSGARVNYRSAFTDQAAAIVSDVYRDDIAAFGYTF